MSKKFMLLALAVISAAFFALPAIASATENHIEGATGKTFSGTSGEGELVAAGEPTIKSKKMKASGEFTSETTGLVNLEFEESTANILGVNLSCKTAGAAAGVIKTSSVFHLITIEVKTETTTDFKPGILVTPPFPTIICGSGASERKIQVTGKGVIGTITSPACNASSATMAVSFEIVGGKQEHMLYTGGTYDLEVTTESGSDVTAALKNTTNLTFTDGVSRKLVCT